MRTKRAGLVYQALVWMIRKRGAKTDRSARYYEHQVRRVEMALQDVGPPNRTTVERVLFLRQRVHELAEKLAEAQRQADKYQSQARAAQRQAARILGYAHNALDAAGLARTQRVGDSVGAGRAARMSLATRVERLLEAKSDAEELARRLAEGIKRRDVFIGEVRARLDRCSDREPKSGSNIGVASNRVNMMGACAVSELLDALRKFDHGEFAC